MVAALLSHHLPDDKRHDDYAHAGLLWIAVVLAVASGWSYLRGSRSRPQPEALRIAS